MGKYISVIEKAIKTLEKIMVWAMSISMILAFISFLFYIVYNFLFTPALNTIGFVFAISSGGTLGLGIAILSVFLLPLSFGVYLFEEKS